MRCDLCMTTGLDVDEVSYISALVSIQTRKTVKYVVVCDVCTERLEQAKARAIVSSMSQRRKK